MREKKKKQFYIVDFIFIVDGEEHSKKKAITIFTSPCRACWAAIRTCPLEIVI